MNIRLSASNTESARRTIELFKPVQAVSMSGSEKPSNLTQSKAKKAYDERVSFFNARDGK